VQSKEAQSTPAYGKGKELAGACRDGRRHDGRSRSIGSGRLALRNYVGRPRTRFESGGLPGPRWVEATAEKPPFLAGRSSEDYLDWPAAPTHEVGGW